VEKLPLANTLTLYMAMLLVEIPPRRRPGAPIAVSAERRAVVLTAYTTVCIVMVHVTQNAVTNSARTRTDRRAEAHSGADGGAVGGADSSGGRYVDCGTG